MKFISYAQNFEDVMLWRALKHVEHGFYVDIGAWSPDRDSVTKAFYERGWFGINIEPNPEFNRQLQERRSRDRSLQVAVGDREGVLTMSFLSNPGLSTLDDAIAERHRQTGLEVDRQEVQVTTLSAIWQQYVPSGQDVHFLKVDVEGFEEAALRGNDWAAHRPWIVVIEATLPMSQVESHDAWEPILLDANYLFAYADGLNRFYVAQEHSDLLQAFNYPPNVFDDFVLSRQVEDEARAAQAEANAQEAHVKARQAEDAAALAETRAEQAEMWAEQAEAKAREAQAKVRQAEGAAKSANARAAQSEAVLTTIYNSRSWRMTAPLRWAADIARWFVRGSIAWLTFAQGSRPRRILRGMLTSTKLWISTHPRLKAVSKGLLSRFPQFETRLRSLESYRSTGRKTYREHYQQWNDGVNPAFLSAGETELTADEILTRIRRELNAALVKE